MTHRSLVAILIALFTPSPSPAIRIYSNQDPCYLRPSRMMDSWPKKSVLEWGLLNWLVLSLVTVIDPHTSNSGDTYLYLWRENSLAEVNSSLSPLSIFILPTPSIHRVTSSLEGSWTGNRITYRMLITLPATTTALQHRLYYLSLTHIHNHQGLPTLFPPSVHAD